MPNLEELRERWLGSNQAAAVAGVSRQTMVEAARDGKVRAVYIGGNYPGRGAWIYDGVDVEAYGERVRQRRGRRDRNRA